MFFLDRRAVGEVVEELRGIRHALVLLNRTVSHLVPVPPPPGDSVAALRLVPTGDPMAATATVPNNQTLPLTLVELDAAGGAINPPVPLDAPPTYLSDNPAVGTVALAPDNFNAVFTPVANAVGTVNVSVTDTVTGRTVTGSIAITVTAVVAALALEPGTPQ